MDLSESETSRKSLLAATQLIWEGKRCIAKVRCSLFFMCIFLSHFLPYLPLCNSYLFLPSSVYFFSISAANQGINEPFIVFVLPRASRRPARVLLGGTAARTRGVTVATRCAVALTRRRLCPEVTLPNSTVAASSTALSGNLVQRLCPAASSSGATV